MCVWKKAQTFGTDWKVYHVWFWCAYAIYVISSKIHQAIDVWWGFSILTAQQIECDLCEWHTVQTPTISMNFQTFCYWDCDKNSKRHFECVSKGLWRMEQLSANEIWHSFIAMCIIHLFPCIVRYDDTYVYTEQKASIAATQRRCETMTKPTSQPLEHTYMRKWKRQRPNLTMTDTPWIFIVCLLRKLHIHWQPRSTSTTSSSRLYRTPICCSAKQSQYNAPN